MSLRTSAERNRASTRTCCWRPRRETRRLAARRRRRRAAGFPDPRRPPRQVRASSSPTARSTTTSGRWCSGARISTAARWPTSEANRTGRTPEQPAVLRQVRGSPDAARIHDGALLRQGRCRCPPVQVKHGTAASRLQHVYLEDTGSFETSLWRCRAGDCLGRVISGMRYRSCSCGERTVCVVTVRQEHPLHHGDVPLRLVRPQRRSSARPSGSEKVVIGSYLGLFDETTSVRSRTSGKEGGDADDVGAVEKAARDAGRSERKSRSAEAVSGRPSAAFAELDRLVRENGLRALAPAKGARANADLRRRRRSAYPPDRGLPPGRREGGYRHGSIDRLDAAEAKVARFGFSDVFVVENFPVALVAYGYSRLCSRPRRDPEDVPAADEAPAAARRRSTRSTEDGIDLLRARRRAVIDWLVDNGVIAGPQPDSATPSDLAAAGRRPC